MTDRRDQEDRQARQTRTEETFSIEVMPFSRLLRKDPELAKARRENADEDPEERRLGADFLYHQAEAERMFGGMFHREGDDPWRGEVMALAVDPTYAPAILTVGTLEYELGRRGEALTLLMTLPELAADTPDLAEIIDKAGDYLIDRGDLEGALELYQAAQAKHPDVAVFPSGASYCLGRLGRRGEGLDLARAAVDLEPDNHVLLTDLGWTLFEDGRLEEAETILRRAVALAPSDYHLAKNNLDEVLKASQGSAVVREDGPPDE